jgi:hypothetical protein
MSDSSCPFCKSPFSCRLSMESHRVLYPSHFGGVPKANVNMVEAASTENLKAKYRRHKEKEE